MTLYVNAQVISEASGSALRAEALLVHGERIAALGTTKELHRMLGPGEDVIDLDGAVLLPGFTDSHLHTALYARSLFSADLRGTASLEETLQRVALHLQQRVETAKAEGMWPGKPDWIFGTAWDHNLWAAPAVPDRTSLDSVTGRFPTALHSGDAHTWWVNSAALQALGITAESPDPAGGHIERHDAGPLAGEPTGILRESAGRPVEQLLASGAAGELTTQLAAAQKNLWALGLTGVHDFDGEDCRDAFTRLHVQGRLGLRVVKSIPQTHLPQAVAEGRFTGAGDAWLRTGPVKIFADGALGSHTCLMHQPLGTHQPGQHDGAHKGSPDGSGIEVTSAAELTELMTTAARSGISVATHAIGDLANTRVLDAYAALAEDAWAGRLPSGLRHRIEHAQHLTAPDVRRFAELGVTASMQPAHATADHELAERLLGGRELHSYAWRSLLETGAALAFGSDAPVETPSPMAGIHSAVTRQRVDGAPAGGWQTQERLNVAEALASYTRGPARAAGLEHLAGQLRPGMFADITALGADPFTVPCEELAQIPVRGVITGGVIRHWH